MLPIMQSYLPDAVPLPEVRRTLVTKLRHHGDVLLTSPVFTTLKRLAPKMEIDALVYRETSPMLENHPAITRIHTIDRDWKRWLHSRHRSMKPSMWIKRRVPTGPVRLRSLR